MEKPLTTKEVPPRFLKSTLMVGHIPHKALASDPRVSYAIYVPPEFFSEGSTTGAAAGAKLPLVVSVHGTRRHVFDIYDLAPFAEATPCAVLVPLFPTGLDGPNDLDSYKLLRSKTLRSDLALLAMLDEVAVRWPEIDTDKIFLAGFSGGGQFAHRFLYLYPERLAAVSVGAPGHVTALDDQQDWPAGIRDVETLFGRGVDKELIKKVPIQLIVGDADNKVHGSGEFWDWLKVLKAQHGIGPATDGDAKPLLPMEKGRIDTLSRLRDAWRAEGIDATLVIVEGGVGHDVKGVRESVLGFVQPWIQKRSGN
ncbi:hypothetical protein M426DRAFT_325620 [Hypoxylon sp. CI-4A]|nr:hypothetical protein M426DRAFT_325620 [Hypoxylon sp. CI-4A]